MTKRRKWICGVIVLTVLVLAFVLFVPQYFFKDEDGKEIEIHRVLSIDSDGEETDITENIDAEKLEVYLYLLKGSRYRTQFAPYTKGKTQYSIDGVYDGEPFHILLGDSNLNVLYESAEKGGYKIKNSNVWLGIVNELRKDIVVYNENAEFEVTENDREEDAWQERVVYETQADLTHDGTPDLVQVVVTPDEEGISTEELLLRYQRLLTVKVYRGMERFVW